MKLRDAIRREQVPEINAAEGCARIPLFRRDGSAVWTMVDVADLDLVAPYRWWEARITRGHTSYAHASVGTQRQGNRHVVQLHRLVTQAPRGTQVDHEDGDGLNNRRSNLRIATVSQNRANEVNQRQRDVSPYRGVAWVDRGEGWGAHLGIDGKTVFLGHYDDAVSAALAYDEAARKTYGEFARTNFTAAQAAGLPRSPRRVRGARFANTHGASRYRHRGCRCETCCAAWRGYMDNENARRRVAYARKKVA